MISSTTCCCAAIILTASLSHAFTPSSSTTTLTYDPNNNNPVTTMIARNTHRRSSSNNNCSSNIRYKKNNNSITALASSPRDLDSAESYDEGAELAKELYERVRVLELQKKLVSEEEQQRRDTRNAELRELNREPFSRRKEVSSAGPKRDTPAASRSMNRNTSSFFSSSSSADNNANNNNGGFFNIGGSDLFSSNGNVNADMSPAQRQQQQRVGRFDSNPLLDAASAEKNILLQAAFVSVLLIVAIGIGMTGGITDGSERVFEDAVFAGDGVMDWMMDGAAASSATVDSSSSDAVVTDPSLGGVFL